MSEHDLQSMYGTRSKETLLWCDGRSQETSRRRCKKTNDDEEDVDELGCQLGASAEERILKKEFKSCNQLTVMITTMTSTDYGQG